MYINITRNTFIAKNTPGCNGYHEKANWSLRQGDEGWRIKQKMYFSTNLQKFGQICFNIFFILLFRLNLQPSFSSQAFFVSSERDIHRTSSPTSLRHWICQKHSHYRSHLLTFRVIVKEVLLKALLQIQRRQWWQKWNLFNSYTGNFRRHFDCLSFARRPRKKKMRVTRDDTIRAKNSTFGFLDATNPIPGKSPVTVSYPDYGSWY